MECALSPLHRLECKTGYPVHLMVEVGTVSSRAEQEELPLELFGCLGGYCHVPVLVHRDS